MGLLRGGTIQFDWAFELGFSKNVFKESRQLASIAETEVFTLSFFDWHGLAMAGPEGMEVFEPLPKGMHRKIKRLRDDLLSREHDPELDDNVKDEGDSESDDNDDDDYDGSDDGDGGYH